MDIQISLYVSYCHRYHMLLVYINVTYFYCGSLVRSYTICDKPVGSVNLKENMTHILLKLSILFITVNRFTPHFKFILLILAPNDITVCSTAT